MAITKQKKKEILEKLDGIIQKNKSLVFVKFNKVTVADASKIRRSMRDAGVGLYVAKKTLIKRALSGLTLTGTMPELEGELALAYGEDLIAPARESQGSKKQTEGEFEIVGGVFEGAYMSKSEMTVIASIPGRQTLLAEFLNVINSPIQGFAVALSEIAKKKA